MSAKVLTLEKSLCFSLNLCLPSMHWGIFGLFTCFICIIFNVNFVVMFSTPNFCLVMSG